MAGMNNNGGCISDLEPEPKVLLPNDDSQPDVQSNVGAVHPTTAPIPHAPLKLSRVALVGMSNAMPGGLLSGSETWAAFAGGRDLIEEIPAARWSPNYLATTPSVVPSSVLHCGFITGIELFDGGHFRTSPAESRAIDPQQRLILEYGYAAFAAATLEKSFLGGSQTGVFLGQSGSDFSAIPR